MENVLIITQILLAITLIFLVLIQSRGTGLARSWGSSSASFTRRGLEKLIFKATFVIAFLFLLISILQLSW